VLCVFAVNSNLSALSPHSVLSSGPKAQNIQSLGWSEAQTPGISTPCDRAQSGRNASASFQTLTCLAFAVTIDSA
jgi:hypothetical protein